MKSSVLKALDRVSSLSAESAELVNQIKAAQPITEETKVIDKLKANIEQLKAEISLLRMEAIPVDTPLSDSEVTEFVHSFNEYLSKSENIKVTLQGYTRNFFAPYSAPVRVVIATTLLNYCTKNDLSASDLWRDIIANVGHM